MNWPKVPTEVIVRGLRPLHPLLTITIVQQVSAPAKAPFEINVRGLW